MEFRLLGPFEVLADDRQLILGGYRQRALLAYLAIHPGRLISTDQLAEELWGGAPPPSARNTLQTYVSHLRAALEPGRQPSASPTVLRTQGPGYRLDVPNEQVDAFCFERLVREGRRALDAGDANTARRTLRAGLELWRGPALADFIAERFAQPTIARLEELRLVAVEARVAADLALGRHTELIAELEALIREHPLRERLRADLMLALYQAGRQADALQAYRQIRKLLAEQLGIEPSSELRQLEFAILRHDSALQPLSSRADRLSAASPQVHAVAHQPASEAHSLADPTAVPAAPQASRDHLAQESAMSAFVGRREQLTQLQAWLADTRGGHGRLVLLAGEPGIGKTRLTRQFAAHAAAAGAQVAWGQVWESEGAPAFWPWTQVFRALLPISNPTHVRRLVGERAAVLAQLLPDVLDRPEQVALPQETPAAARFRLFSAVMRVLGRAAAERPLVIVLDDLHWADTPSLWLLKFVTRELADVPLLVVGLYRDIGAVPAHGWPRTLGELTKEPVCCRVHLEGLASAEVAQLVDHITGQPVPDQLIKAIHARTLGNPFFASELAQLLATTANLDRFKQANQKTLPVPQGVFDVVRQRLLELSPRGRSVLTLAAVVGGEFDLVVLDAAAKLAGGLRGERLVAAIEQAMTLGFVADLPGQAGRLRFAHGLVRDALYQQLSGARRMHLHEQVGRGMQQAYVGQLDAHLAELAHHFFQAMRPGHAGEAVAYARQAGDRAMKMLAYEQAAGHYEQALQALDLHDSSEQAERCELLLNLGAACRAAGEIPASRAHFERAASLAKAMGAGEQLVKAAFGLGAEFTAGTVDSLEIQLLEDALTMLGGADSVLRARVLGRLARALQPLPDPNRRTSLSEEAVAVARRIGDRATLAAVLYDRHLAIWGPGNAQERLAISTEVVQLAKTSSDSVMALKGHGFRMANLLELGDLAALQCEREAYEHLAQELRLPHFLWHIPLFNAGQAILRGRFDEAEKLIHHAWVLGQRARDPVAPIYLAIVSLLRCWTAGRPIEAEAKAREFVDRYPGNPGWRATLAVILCDGCRKEEARVEFERIATNDFGGLLSNHLWTFSIAMLSIVSHALGDVVRASRLYDLLTPYRNRNVTIARLPLGSVGSVSHYLGLLAAAMSRWDDAIRHFEAAIRTHERMEALPLVAHSRYQYAQVLFAKGGEDDRQIAQEQLNETQALARNLGIVMFGSG